MDNLKDFTRIEDFYDHPKLTSIQKFYQDSTIFITGGTGLIGNLVIAKLLSECPGINSIYVLIRTKKGKTMNERMEHFFDDVVYDKLKQKFPKFLHKIIGVEGDCILPDLGLSHEDKNNLINNVHIVFHIAATVKFNEPLKIAANINVRATCEVLRLAEKMSKLKSYIHVSTAFSNCPYKVIQERIYPVDVNYKKILLLTECFSDEELEKLKPMLLKGHPNTYTFTKQIAEDAIKQYGGRLPIGIFRPSIVSTTYKEPLQGWSNNYYGIIGVCAGIITGLMRTLQVDGDCVANIVPADMCANAMIAAAWDVGDKYENNESKDKIEIPIFNYESTNDNPIRWKNIVEYYEKYKEDTPSSQAVWYCSFTGFKSYLLYLVYAFFLHTIPAYAIDIVLLCLGKEPRAMKIYSKIHEQSILLSYFTTRSWIYQSQNMERLNDKMSKEDRSIFFCDLKIVDWNEYFEYFFRGIRVYLNRDPLDNLKEAKVKWNRLYWAHQIVKTVTVLLLLRLIWGLAFYILSIFS